MPNQGIVLNPVAFSGLEAIGYTQTAIVTYKRGAFEYFHHSSNRSKENSYGG